MTRRPCSDSRHVTAPYKLALYYYYYYYYYWPIGQVRTLCECHLYTAKLVPVGADIDFLHKAEKLSACMVYAYTACDYVYMASGNDARNIKTCRCTRMHVISLVCIFFTVSFQAQNSPFPQIFSTIVC